MFSKFLLSSSLLLAMAASAVAADLPSEKGPPVYTPPPPPPVFSWTGVYIGAQVGYAWNNSSNPYDETFGFALPNESNGGGVIGGGHVGYNYELGGFGLGSGGFVVGLEGDVNGSSQSATGVDGVDYLGVVGYTTRKDVDASIRGRIGYAWDRVLIYGTGGGAWGNFRTTYYDNLGDFDGAFNHGRFGWTVGGGIEYAIDNNWSVRAEYRYSDYGHITDFAATTTGDLISQHIRDNRVQAGFSYKFDMFAPPAPVVSKY
jgi:outer membrane immunogenic protein